MKQSDPSGSGIKLMKKALEEAGLYSWTAPGKAACSGYFPGITDCMEVAVWLAVNPESLSP